MNNGSYKKKVDLAGELDLKIKEYNKQLAKLKDEIKIIAEKKNKKMLEGHIFTAVISPMSSSKCEARDLLKFLRKRGEEKKFVDLVKVDLTSAKRYLKEEINVILKITVKEFGKVQFIRK